MNNDCFAAIRGPGKRQRNPREYRWVYNLPYNPSCPLLGHEVWDVENGKTGIARLKEINRVCQDCSSIHHFGRTETLAKRGTITPEEFQRTIQHFQTVNNCDQTAFARHHREAWEEWRRRNEVAWDVDLAHSRILLNQAWNPLRHNVR
jgi:hypothetical protein